MSERPGTAGRINHEFTPRQKQVLDLLVHGRTNREIADSLGITLDGAKWHISEIISRLGVESREDAANYWRHETGLPVRIIRFLRGMAPGAAAGKALVLGATAGLAIGIGATAWSLFGDGDVDSADGGEPTLITSPATPTPTSTPTVGPKEREMTALALTPTATPIPVSNGVCPPGIDQGVCDFAMSIQGEPAAGWRTLAIRELQFECPTDNSFQFVQSPLCEDREPGTLETGYVFGVKVQQFVNEEAFRDSIVNWGPPGSQLVAIGCLRESEVGSFDCSSEISVVFESAEMGLVALFATRTGDEFPVHAALAGGFVESAGGWMLAAYGPMSEPRPDIWLMPWQP